MCTWFHLFALELLYIKLLVVHLEITFLSEKTYSFICILEVIFHLSELIHVLSLKL